MNKLFCISTNGLGELDVELTENDVRVIIPNEGSFRINAVEGAEKLRDILDAWIVLKNLDED